MTLKQIKDGLDEIALRQPSVNTVIEDGNIYTLNEMRNVRFGVYCTTQREHTYNVETSRMQFNFFLYYCDRLKSNEENKIEAQSTGIQTINNILRVFQDKYDVDVSEVTYTPFTESFSEMTCGVYASVTITAYDDGCTIEF